jgi:hypothetical protein
LAPQPQPINARKVYGIAWHAANGLRVFAHSDLIMATAIERSAVEQDIRPGSDRSFGFVFAIVFAIVGLWPLMGGHGVRWWALGIAAAFAIVAVVKADLLRPLNWLWFRFGMLLARIVNPLVMGAVFFLCVTPIGLIMRARRKDLLSLRWRREDKSYWIMREAGRPANESMKKQF